MSQQGPEKRGNEKIVVWIEAEYKKRITTELKKRGMTIVGFIRVAADEILGITE